MDVVYYGNQRQLEYDFIVAPGTDPSIALAFEGTDQLEVDAQGDLILYTTGRPIQLQKPLIYQEVDGVKRHISGGYVVRPLPIGEHRGEGKPQVGFQVAAYDPRRPLIIDPILDYSTYLGTSNQDQAGGIAIESIGNAYVTGFTDSPNLHHRGCLRNHTARRPRRLRDEAQHHRLRARILYLSRRQLRRLGRRHRTGQHRQRLRVRVHLLSPTSPPRQAPSTPASTGAISTST